MRGPAAAEERLHCLSARVLAVNEEACMNARALPRHSEKKASTAVLICIVLVSSVVKGRS
jgi:hypothetical protein